MSEAPTAPTEREAGLPPLPEPAAEARLGTRDKLALYTADQMRAHARAALAHPVPAPVREATIRAAVEKYLRDNDPEGFGCACVLDYTCGPCRERQRQAPLRAALQEPK